MKLKVGNRFVNETRSIRPSGKGNFLRSKSPVTGFSDKFLA